MITDPSAPKPFANLLVFVEANAIPLASALMVLISTIYGMLATR